ncbi:unnamed protein product, partial [Medioppia subpectinata]
MSNLNALNKRIEIDQTVNSISLRVEVQDVVCRTSGGTEKCYYIIDKVVNEVEAKTYCSSLDSTARLLSIHSVEEAIFVT